MRARWTAARAAHERGLGLATAGVKVYVYPVPDAVLGAHFPPGAFPLSPFFSPWPVAVPRNTPEY